MAVWHLQKMFEYSSKKIELELELEYVRTTEYSEQP